jgi:hypothetical protein
LKVGGVAYLFKWEFRLRGRRYRVRARLGNAWPLWRRSVQRWPGGTVTRLWLPGLLVIVMADAPLRARP